ncbi:MAG: hypothetical protein KZQ70_15500 [gamma proteobacterium symbiont of Lucinoma myriamae]|nr:hypothetical protein [gamma proteobacterium symbiont of Lucinoma myriamae]
MSSLTNSTLLNSDLNRQEIEQRLPHAGKMSLLDKVTHADLLTLSASAVSHLNSDNPLRFNNKLSSINGIEYAAQAMAIHSFLLSELKSPNINTEDSRQTGYIATVRNIDIFTPDFPETESVIKIEVEQLMSDTNGFTYQFHISDGKKTLISGKITVFLTHT